ncbi:MAG: alpha/beta fold hydrolase [Cyclobacteriaceae bacterium]
MPILSGSSYRKRPFFLINGHLETVVPSLFRKINGVNYQRERLELADGDFLDIDWLLGDNDKLLVLSHGLEGNSDRHYVKGTAKYFHDRGWDVLAWNYRSCSEEMNRLPRMYHHGVTDDLEAVIVRGLKEGYDEVNLIGFSMGGSTTLKFLGEQGDRVDNRITGAAVFSVPCNLWDSAIQLAEKSNRFYKNRFLNKLKKKIALKAEMYPEIINVEGLENITSFDEFDERYTAPLHGFKDAKDFYVSSSSDQFYHNIKVRSIVVNAINDPLLGEKCYPYEIVRNHSHLSLETPKLGGHVGFTRISGPAWMEERAYEFLVSEKKSG